MKKRLALGFVTALIVLAGAVIWHRHQPGETALSLSDTSFIDEFERSEILEETGQMDASRSVFWWVNSGGQLRVEEGVGKTLHGEAPVGSRWQIAYAANKAGTTDNGSHPQNLFRLITRSRWLDFQQEATFKITHVTLSEHPDRNESNGLLLFSRYLDQGTLYYAGLRVDGAAVIKRKYQGEYTTLAYEPVFEGTYSRENNPNLLPTDTWLGLRTRIVTLHDGAVEIRLYMDRENSGQWDLVLTALDQDPTSGGAPILTEGYAGIRTDFMDVTFDHYHITMLDPAPSSR